MRERRKALYDRFVFSQKFAQDDPWAERVAGKDKHEFRPTRRRSRCAEAGGMSAHATRPNGSTSARSTTSRCAARAASATPQGKIAVFRTADDQVFALEDHCPHKGGPLSQGIVQATAVTCPLHNWVISLETGKALGADEGCGADDPGAGRRRTAVHRARSRASAAA